MQFLGMQHIVARRMASALSGILIILGRCQEARELQQQVQDTCVTHLGPGNHDNLVGKQILGETLFHDGNLNKARDLQEERLGG